MGRKTWRVVAIAMAGALVAGASMLAWLNPRLTRYIESDPFRAKLEQETAKGLHFSGGNYAPIKRTSFLTATSAEFQAQNGRKAMRSMYARGITAKFNPFGVFLRRWQLDEVRIQSGQVGIQTYTPQPEPSPAKPWYHIVLPERVYLKRVESEPVDVTWRFRDKPAGFFGTRLLITPHGGDFNYQATGGMMKMALMPDLHLRQTQMLITKKSLTLYHLDLAPNPQSDGAIHLEGKAGTGDDRSVDCKIDIKRVPIEQWLPPSWKEHFTGSATGNVHWTGKNPKLEASSGNGELHLSDAKIDNLPFLEKLATLTQKKSLAHLRLNECGLDLKWSYPKIDISNIAIEEKGKFRIAGKIDIEQKSLGGEIELGVAREYLDWLPKADGIFTRERDGYLWTTVHLSGTIDQPQQDLSPRIMEMIKENPAVALALFFRQIGDALKHALGEE